MSDTQRAQQGQIVVVAHDLKRLATSNDGGPLGHFTVRVPAWDAHIRLCRSGAIATAVNGAAAAISVDDTGRRGALCAGRDLRVDAHPARLSRSGIAGGAEAAQAEPSAVSELDLRKLGRIIAMVGSSHEGEALTALRLVDRMLRDAGMRWEDLLSPAHELDIATEAAVVLLDENTALKAELEQLRTTGTAIATWSEVGAAIANTQRAAQWALDLHRQGRVWLSDFEVGFLSICAQWDGRLTPKQGPRFRRIMERIAVRTGMTPPE
jgi:hypothetical protein